VCTALCVAVGCASSDEPQPEAAIEPTVEEAAPAPPATYFTNVTAEAGLTDQRSKDCVLTDLDGDGYWDLVLDRRRVYRNAGGERFEPVEDAGFDFPVVPHVRIGNDGKFDPEKTQAKELVPQYLYFADLDNDGDTDAVWGVHASWEWYDGESESWKVTPEADHGLRTHVYLNDGTGRFAKGPWSAISHPTAAGSAMALAIVDVDGDGCLDLFEGREYRKYGFLFGSRDLLWKGDGTGRFTDVTEAAGLATVEEPATDFSSRPTYGVTHGDLDNDGWTDLLGLSYGRQWNYQWRNRGDGTFQDVARDTGFAGDDITHGKYPQWLQDVLKERKRPPRQDEDPFRSNGNTFDCAIADYDNDGDLDCFLGEIAHAWAGESSDLPSLLINLGPEEAYRFQRIPVTALLPPREFRSGDRWNYGDLHVAWLDYDNDTLQDLLIASGDYPDGQFLRLYRQLPDHTFEEVTEAAGFDWEGCGSVSLGDYDRDGDVDVVVGRSFMRLSKAHREKYLGGITVNEVGLFRNDGANFSGNHWLNVRLAGSGAGGANRAGIGARVTVTAGGVTQLREIRCGAGLANHQDPPEACFGLGSADRVERLVVRWPDAAGSEQEFRDLPADRFVEIRQGDPKPHVSR
jgi:hypothetical protein